MTNFLKQKDSFSVIIVIYVCLLLIIPARFYQLYSLSDFKFDSGVNVNYLNLVDIGQCFLSVILLFFIKNKIFFDKENLVILLTSVVTSLFFATILVFSDKVEYSAELISKINTFLCAYLFALFYQFYLTERLKIMVYLLPLFILSIAPLFLSDYGTYASQGRIGTLGFFSNEAALFASVLLSVALFFRRQNLLLRILLGIVALLCLFQVSSRRGVLLTALIIFSLTLIKIYYLERLSIERVLLLIFLLIILFMISFKFASIILERVRQTPLVIRLRYLNASDISILYLSDRQHIYKDIFRHIEENFIFGSFGSDKLFAQDGRSHAHNLFLQFIATNGFFIGSILSLFFINTFLRSIRIVINGIKAHTYDVTFIVSLFFITYILFEMFGYLLWNQKGLFWIMTSVFIINYNFSVGRIDFLNSSYVKTNI